MARENSASGFCIHHGMYACPMSHGDFVWDEAVMMGLLIVWKLTDVFGWGKEWWPL